MSQGVRPPDSSKLETNGQESVRESCDGVSTCDGVRQRVSVSTCTSASARQSVARHTSQHVEKTLVEGVHTRTVQGSLDDGPMGAKGAVALGLRSLDHIEEKLKENLGKVPFGKNH